MNGNLKKTGGIISACLFQILHPYNLSNSFSFSPSPPPLSPSWRARTGRASRTILRAFCTRIAWYGTWASASWAPFRTARAKFVLIWKTGVGVVFTFSNGYLQETRKFATFTVLRARSSPRRQEVLSHITAAWWSTRGTSCSICLLYTSPSPRD